MSTSGSSRKRSRRQIEAGVDNLAAQTGKVRRDAVLDQVAGLWKDRDDLPDFTALRKHWNRVYLTRKKGSLPG